MKRAIALLMGFALIVLSLSGLMWWQATVAELAAWQSRNVLQYYIPYMIFSAILVLGAVQFRKAV